MNSKLQPEKVRRLLVRGTNWVGDSVMVLPALKQVRRIFSQADISLLVHPWVSGIYEEADFIDELLVYDREGQHRGMYGRWKLIRALQRKQFELAILFQNAFEAALLAKLAGIPLRAGYSRDARGWLLSHPIDIDPRVTQLHQTYYYLDLIDQLIGNDRIALAGAAHSSETGPTATQMADISIAVSAERRQLARQCLQAQGTRLTGKLVGVNPGAAFGSAKRWLLDRYAALLDRLIEREGAEAVIFGAPNEVGIAHSVQSFMRNRPIVLSGQTQLSELIAMIACCDLFITNDSGPMHLAAALRIPTIAIFGPTDAIATGPLSLTAAVLNKRVECSPCLLRECPIDHRCMTRITVDEVYQQAVLMLGNPLAKTKWVDS